MRGLLKTIASIAMRIVFRTKQIRFDPSSIVSVAETIVFVSTTVLSVMKFIFSITKNIVSIAKTIVGIAKTIVCLAKTIIFVTKTTLKIHVPANLLKLKGVPRVKDNRLRLKDNPPLAEHNSE